MKQLLHSEIKNLTHSKELIVICDHIQDKKNIGMIFRIADAFGVKKIVLINEEKKEIDQRLRRISRATLDIIPHLLIGDIHEYIEKLKKEKYHILALEKCDDSMAIYEKDWVVYRKIAMIIGHENNGVSPRILDSIDSAVHISMYGKNSSMNVVNALAVGLYEVTKGL
ncbi:MAG: TrmH family RNA methyltransferase [Saprospiraceae bacterium]